MNDLKKVSQSDAIAYLKKLDDLKKGIRAAGEAYLLEQTEYQLDQNMYQIFVEKAREILRRKIKSSDNAVISITLVNFAIREFKAHFWEEFASRLRLDRLIVERKCKEAFKEFCKQYNLYFYEGKKNQGYVTSILTHSILPDAHMQEFLEFMYELYFHELEEQYVLDEVDALTEFMYGLFNKFLEDEDISISYKGSKLTVARQKLPKSFRIAYVKSPEYVMELVRKIFKTIHTQHYGNPDNEDNDNNNRFISYLKTHPIEKKRETTENKNPKERSDFTKMYKTGYFELIGEHKELVFQLPEQKLDVDEFDNLTDGLELRMYSGDDLIQTRSLKLLKRKITIRTEKTTVSLDSFYPDFRYDLVTNERKLYTSHEKLSNRFLLFDESGEQINSDRIKPGKIRILHLNGEEPKFENVETHFTTVKEHYTITTAFLNEDSVINISKNQLGYVKKDYEDSIEKECICRNVIISDEENEYNVYYKIPYITFKISNEEQVKDYVIEANQSLFELNDIGDCQCQKIMDGNNDQNVEFTLWEEFFLEHNPVRLKLRRKSSNRVKIEASIFFLPGFSYRFDKNYYYEEKVALLEELRLDETNILIAPENSYQCDLNTMNTYKTDFVYREKRYALNIELPLLKWNIGAIESESQESRDLWCKDLDTKNEGNDYELYIDSPFEIREIICKTNGSFQTIQTKKSHNRYKFKLESLFRTIDKEPISILIDSPEKKEHITTIYFKPTIRDIVVKYARNTHSNKCMSGLYLKWDFIGDNVDIEITDLNERQIKQYSGYKMGAGHINDMELNLEAGEYQINFFKEEKDPEASFFGATKKRKNVFESRRFKVVEDASIIRNYKLLEGKECICNGKRFKLSNFYIEHIQDNPTEPMHATAFFYRKDWDTEERYKSYFDLNPFQLGNMEKLSELRLSFEISDNEGDGLYYDKQTGFVNPRNMDDNDNTRYEVIDSIVFKQWEG